WVRGVIDGIPVLSADRGGSATYHGPGQLVGYPILWLRTYCAGPKAYVNCLEEILIRALDAFGVPAGRRAGMPGVWVGDRSVAEWLASTGARPAAVDCVSSKGA